jgi:ATPase subunit of ABC transporter with duplicated ATPase domains
MIRLRGIGMSQRVLLNLKNIAVQLPDRLLFESLSFSVHSGELLALLGPNGCGKSTVVEAIRRRCTGHKAAVEDSHVAVTGEIFCAAGINIGHLPQALARDAVTQRDDGGTPEERSRAAKLREEFGLSDKAASGGAASDGERQKLDLVRVLTADCDLYLLDEPTNYLDMTGITAFEYHVQRLLDRGKGVVLVSHDRMLVDNLATQTVLITRGGIYSTIGGSTRAWSLLTGDIESREKQIADIRKKIRQLQADMTAKAGWAARKEKQKIGAGGAKGHISRLSKKMAKRAKVAQQRAEKEIERLEETKPYIPKRLNLQFKAYEIRHRAVFSLEQVRFAYADPSVSRSQRRKHPLIEDVTLSASTRDKICLMGTNGSGKSTLLRLVQKHLRPSRGRSYLNRAVKTAYVPQGLSGFFQRESLLDNFADCPCDETTIRRHLGSALIRGDKAHEPVMAFSYGELMRAAIVKCLLLRAEFLFLDEPTSHLDIESIEVLEQLLGQFHGGMLVISHDRAFVENVAETLYMLESGQLRLV